MSSQLSQRLSRLYTSKTLPWIIICVGIALRLIRYLHSTSLGFDEANIAVDLCKQSLPDLFNPSPDFIQTSPFGFLILIKLASNVFGNSEYAFRLFPLLFGIISLFLFYRVAKHFIKPEAVPIALGLFAILDPLVFFASELKPYMGDIAITLLIYSATIYIQSKKLTASRIVFYGVFGATVLWFSHPSLFVLTGIGAILTISFIIRKEWLMLQKALYAFSFWALSFLTAFFIFTRKSMAYISSLTNNDMFWMKAKAFMPLPPMSLSDIQWFLDLPTRIFNFPVGLTLTGLATFTFLAGCVSMFSEKKESFFMLILPALIALLASSFKKYAFVSVTIFFIVPSILLIIAEGTDYIRKKTSHNASVIGIVLIGLLFLYPLSWAAYHAVKPNAREEIKPVLSHIKANWQEGDILYVYYMSLRAFDYYSKYHPGNFHFNEGDYILGRAQKDWYASYRRQDFTGFWDKDKPFSQPYASVLNEYVDDLNKLRGHKRVWLLFSNKVMKSGIHEEMFFLYHLENIGMKLDSFGNAGNAAVYLYDLSGNSKATGSDAGPDE